MCATCAFLAYLNQSLHHQELGATLPSLEHKELGRIQKVNQNSTQALFVASVRYLLLSFREVGIVCGALFVGASLGTKLAACAFFIRELLPSAG